ncbi:MAG TPA: aldehyde dehydrogenase family protein, partial [bacterium]|nr:aldehyde dehydrogenase family protein [bacterium]
MAKKSNSTIKKIQSVNPATLEVNCEIEPTPAEDVKAIVAGAREAQVKWAAAGLSERLRYIRKVKHYLTKHMDEICRIITLDNGKTLVESLNTEVMPVLDMVNFCLKDAPAALRDEHLHNPMFKLLRIRSRNIFEPLGVVAVIAPWNFPFTIPTTQILMALTAGNTVVLKPAAMTAYVGDL